MTYLIVAATALAAGLVQGVTGFGSGIVQMFTYPMLWGVTSAAAVSACASVPLNVDMVLTYRRSIRRREVLAPVVPYLIVCSAAISLSRGADPRLIRKLFGLFLLLLSLYYLFVDHGGKVRMGAWKACAFIVVSALCDAFFGIGGPLMVLYYLNRTDSKEEYLGTIAAFFLINGVWNTAFRIYAGILTAERAPHLLVAIAGIVAGVTVAHRVVGRLDGAALKKVIYVMIGFSGLANMLS